MLGFWLWLWLGSEYSVRVLIFPPEPSKEFVKVSHVIFECRVINHHPILGIQIVGRGGSRFQIVGYLYKKIVDGM